MQRNGAIVVATPWPRSGSANIFAAQCGFYARAGHAVCLYLGPIERGHRVRHQSFWAKTLRLMHSPHLALVTYGRTNRSLKPWLSLSHLHWLRHGRESMLNVMARFAAGSAHAPAFEDFVANHRIRYVHANHAFQVLLAEKLIEFIQRRQGVRPMLLIDSHDVQTMRFTTQSIANCFSRSIDPFDALLRDEIALYERGDLVIHLAQHDLDFFSHRLRKARQGLVMPTLDPATEADIARSLARADPTDIDFLFVGQRHPANIAGIRWLLQDVLPSIGHMQYKIVIAGNIGDHFRKREPRIFQRYRSFFHFEAHDVASLYARAAVVVVPSFGATGSSIKLIEAMAAGKPIVATRAGLAGLPHQVRAAWQEPADPADFARQMVSSRTAAQGRGADGARLYRTWFANERYYRALDALIRAP